MQKALANERKDITQAIAIRRMLIRKVSKKRKGTQGLERQVNKGVIGESYGNGKKEWREFIFLEYARARWFFRT